MKKLMLLLVVSIAITGCGEPIVTDTGVLLDSLSRSEARCNRYHATGEGTIAYCGDVEQLKACLRGVKSQCPLKGYGEH